jgi:LPXTG-site transpeptidase (sortase) family protein
MFSRRRTAVALLGMGFVLLAVSAAYYGYIFVAGTGLDRLEVNGDQEEGILAGFQDASGTKGVPNASGPDPRNQTLYPGAFLSSRLWADPRGTLRLGQEDLNTGFIPLEPGAGLQGAGVTQASRLSIPAVGIDATVEELSIRNLQNSREYETPKFTVGHIPQSPNPGAQGNGWYFGHLESIFSDEGNVFSRLPQVPELLQSGEEVFIVTYAQNTAYLYRVSQTDIVYQDDLTLYETDNSSITLVACYPRLKYDHRLLVTAELVGYRPLTSEV